MNTIQEEEALLMDAGQLLSDTMVALSGKQPLAAEDIFKELSQITAAVTCYRSPLEEYPQGQTIADVMRKVGCAYSPLNRNLSLMYHLK